MPSTGPKSSVNAMTICHSAESCTALEPCHDMKRAVLPLGFLREMFCYQVVHVTLAADP